MRRCRRIELKQEAAFTVAFTGDFRGSDGGVRFDPEALANLRRNPSMDVEFLTTDAGEPIAAGTLRRCDSLVMKRSPLSPELLLDAGPLRLVHIAREGVGLEHLDLAACTAAGILVTTTPEAVRRPMASAAMAFILALAHGLKEKDRLLREEGWVARHSCIGTGLAGRTLGVVGCGNIGAELLRLAAPWGMRHLAVSPSRSDEEVAALGAQRVSLRELLKESDFTVLCCPLNEATRRMIDERALRQVKRGGFLVNIGRGGLVDEAALLESLVSGHLAGAALDVFDPEPPARGNPLLSMPNVVVSAHNIGLSEESRSLGNRAVADAVQAFARGELPKNIANPDAAEHPRVRSAMCRARAREAARSRSGAEAGTTRAGEDAGRAED